jgi:hypothetical protein
MKLSYNQARECVFRIYEGRGYDGGVELTNALSKLGMINLEERSMLKGMLLMLQDGEAERKRQRRLGNKIRKKLK